MSDRAEDRTWSIARLLLCWVVFAAAVLVITVGIDLRVTISQSVWDPAASIVRWFALGYGVYFVNRMLPVYVAHGRTRHELLRSMAVFLLVAAAMVAAPLTFGLALESVPYRLVDWPHRVPAERLFDSAGQYPLVFLPLCLAGLLPGAAATWALVRDIPIRSRVV
jgi:hypothetical protein